MSDQGRTCYVSAQSGISVGSLRLELEKLGVSATSAESMPPAGEASPTTLRQALRKVDFVVGVLSDDADQTGVVFEIGVAAGLGKPIFVVYVGLAAALPAFQFLPSVRAKSPSDEALQFHLRQFVRNSKKRIEKAPAPSTRRSPENAKIVNWYETIGHPRSESDLERLVRDALVAFGATVSMQQSIKSTSGRLFRPDLVAWFNNAPEGISNPVLIEVRPEGSSVSIEQLRRYMNEVDTGSAMLVSDSDASDVRVEKYDAGYIFELSTHRLLTELANGTLFDTLLRQRNVFIHAGAS